MQIHQAGVLCRVVMILSAVLLGGCALTGPAPVSDARSSPGAVDGGASGSSGIKQALYREHDRWRGTRYRVGGMGSGGFDCSGLTYFLYRDMFGARLPRTTKEQVKVGHAVKRAGLAPGDLVFFKTGVFQKHVGVYIEDGWFLHASRSDGVRLSNLGNSYWRKRYWQARRLDGI